MIKDVSAKRVALIIACVVVMAILLLAFMSTITKDETHTYKTNGAGLTYGKQLENSDEEPDLLEVTATNGKTGYIKTKDVNKYGGGNVSTPEEAAAYMESDEPIKLNVYKEDGTTVIGFFYLDGTTELKKYKSQSATSAVDAEINSEGRWKTFKGYKYTYKGCSDVWLSTGHTCVRQKGTTNVPKGYMGGLARIYTESGTLKASSKWQYNDSKCNEDNTYTKSIKGKGYYYSHGKARVYNGDGYTTYTLYKSTNQKLTSNVEEEAYKVNEKGETYGLGIYEDAIGGEPDLIQAVGINGKIGYVRSEDFETKNGTPKEAAENSISDGEDKKEYISLYDLEGNVIDRFEIESRVELEGSAAVGV